MIDNIVITPGIAIVILSWICTTFYAIIRKDKQAMWIPLYITILYGLFRAIVIRG